jgi:hypothetical protein
MSLHCLEWDLNFWRLSISQQAVAVFPRFLNDGLIFDGEPSGMCLLEGIATISDFADAKTFAVLKDSFLLRPSGLRVHIPTHKRGVTIPYSEIRRSFPDIARFYQSEQLARRISEATGIAVLPTPFRDQSSCSVLIYERPGDRIGWHYDHNFYNGRHFTALLPLVNEHTLYRRLSSAELVARTRTTTRIIPTPPNTLVLFEGAIVRHTVTPLGPAERRVVLSMTFCADPTTTPLRNLQRRFKDIAYLGIRALWTSNS